MLEWHHVALVDLEIYTPVVDSINCLDLGITCDLFKYFIYKGKCFFGFRSNMSLLPEDSWLPIASIISCIIHVQVGNPRVSSDSL